MIGKKAQEYDRLDLNMGNFALPFGDFPAIEVGNSNIEVSEDEPSEITFVLDEVPGAPDAKEIVVTQDADDEDISAEVTIDDGEVDKWKWEPKTFLVWLKNMFDNVPTHSGHDSTGLEKAISYFEALDREITKAMRSDYKNEIDNAQAETAREQIENGIERLVDRLKQVNTSKYKRKAKKKASDDSEGLIKEAQKATRINGITITVPLLISRIARVCINGTVSAGHDIEDMFERQATEYNLDKRERAELSQLIADMGWPMIQDRGFAPGTNVDMARSDNYDWGANFKG
jgi:hypothetical protein